MLIIGAGGCSPACLPLHEHRLMQLTQSQGGLDAVEALRAMQRLTDNLWAIRNDR